MIFGSARRNSIANEFTLSAMMMRWPHFPADLCKLNFCQVRFFLDDISKEKKKTKLISRAETMKPTFTLIWCRLIGSERIAMRHWSLRESNEEKKNEFEDLQQCTIVFLHCRVGWIAFLAMISIRMNRTRMCKIEQKRTSKIEKKINSLSGSLLLSRDSLKKNDEDDVWNTTDALRSMKRECWGKVNRDNFSMSPTDVMSWELRRCFFFYVGSNGRKEKIPTKVIGWTNYSRKKNESMIVDGLVVFSLDESHRRNSLDP